MATINANITGYEQITINLFGYPYIVPIYYLSIASTQMNLNDYVQISGSVASCNGSKVSTIAFWVWRSGLGVPEGYYCNIPTNTELVTSNNNYTMKLTRTADKTFVLNDNGTTNTTTLSSNARGYFKLILLKFTDGVCFSDFDFEVLQYDSNMSMVVPEVFQTITFKDLTSSAMPVFGGTSISYNQSSIDRANFVLNSIPPTDPYSGAGDSTTGGGDGTFDGTSDPVPVPNLPSVGAQDSGFITLFAPTAQQMKDLAHYMWVNPLFDLTAFKKIFADPMDCILGLSVVPVSVPTSGAKNVNIGNLVTSVSMNVASQQYIEIDCGTVDFSARYFGSYLDFEPYTKISIFLPYCGTHQLNADDIIGRTVGVVYHIDILTGSCIAFVKCGDSVLYEFNGACGSNIPVNSLNFASTIENAIRIAVNIGTTVATAGASAPITTGANVAQREAMRQAQQKATAISLAGSTAEGALSMKPNVSRSGALGGGVGLLGHQIPYIIISRPRLCKPKNQDFFEGYPSFIQTTIGDLVGKGFTSFTDVIIASQYLTDSEESELEEILQGGVYL